MPPRSEEIGLVIKEDRLLIPAKEYEKMIGIRKGDIEFLGITYHLLDGRSIFVRNRKEGDNDFERMAELTRLIWGDKEPEEEVETMFNTKNPNYPFKTAPESIIIHEEIGLMPDFLKDDYPKRPEGMEPIDIKTYTLEDLTAMMEKMWFEKKPDPDMGHIRANYWYDENGSYESYAIGSPPTIHTGRGGMLMYLDAGGVIIKLTINGREQNDIARFIRFIRDEPDSTATPDESEAS
jgi:hypothetical protein